MSDALEGMKARLEAAAEGPWRVEVHDLTRWVFSADEGLEAKLGYIGNRNEADAEFIAAAPTDMGKLLAALDAVERECRYLDTLTGGDKHYASVFRKVIAAALGEGL